MVFSWLGLYKKRRERKRINDEINQQIRRDRENRRSEYNILLMGLHLILFLRIV